MSILRERIVSCPSCDQPVTAKVFQSINADRRADLRQAILDGSLQVTTCPECGAEFRVDPRFNYLHIDRGIWIAVLPAGELGDWEQHEAMATDSFDRAYGARATGPAKAIGDGLTTRLVFGWPALREKIWLNEAGIDDLSVETAKLELMRAKGLAHVAGGEEMRVVAGGETSLDFGWYTGAGQPTGEGMRVPRSLLAAIDANPEWAPMREALMAGPLVDAQKLYIATDQPA